MARILNITQFLPCPTSDLSIPCSIHCLICNQHQNNNKKTQTKLPCAYGASWKYFSWRFFWPLCRSSVLQFFNFLTPFLSSPTSPSSLQPGLEHPVWLTFFSLLEFPWMILQIWELHLYLTMFSMT